MCPEEEHKPTLWNLTRSLRLTPRPKTSHVYESEAIPPPKDTPTPIQESRHVAATPSIQQQIKMNRTDHKDNWARLSPLLGQDSVTILQLIK